MICSLFSALFILIGLSVYAGKSGIPFKKPYEKGSFSWSFIIAWVSWVLTIAAAAISFFDDELPLNHTQNEMYHMKNIQFEILVSRDTIHLLYTLFSGL